MSKHAEDILKWAMALDPVDTPFLNSIKNPWYRPTIGWTEPVNARKHRFWQRLARLPIFEPFDNVQEVIRGSEVPASWLTMHICNAASVPLRVRNAALARANANGPQPIYDPDWKAPERPTRMVWGMAERRDHEQGPLQPDRDQSERDHEDGPIADEGQNA